MENVTIIESLTDLLSGYSRQLNGDIEKQNAVMKWYLVSINQRIERLEEEMTRRISVQRSNCGPYMTTTGSSQTISPSHLLYDHTTPPETVSLHPDVVYTQFGREIEIQYNQRFYASWKC